MYKMNNQTKPIVIAGALLLISAISVGAYFLFFNKQEQINSFEECVSAGYDIMESYPRQCSTEDGQTFTETIDPEGIDQDQTQDETTGLANPASVFCTENDGVVDYRETEEGAVGYCIFESGEECEEWAYYRGECESR